MSVANIPHPLIALPLWRRIAVGAALGVGVLSWAVLILWVMTLTGGRYQTLGHVADTEYDMWALSLAYPLGLATAGAVATALAPRVRRGWHAALLGFVSAIPVFALISLCTNPRGAHPYQVGWPLSLGLAAALGGFVGAGMFSELPRAIARRRPTSRNAVNGRDDR